MKKTTLALSLLLLVCNSFAQSVADAMKMLQYGKEKSAQDILQKLYASNSNDANTVYWLGQSMIAVDDVDAAKAVYQKALQAGVNNPLLYIGMAHVDLLNGENWNSANQKFESALTTTAETRGKNKGKSPIDIYNAIGRANTIGHLVSDGSSKFGNAQYAIEKLDIAATVDATNTDCFIYKGLAYRKMGGEFGGEALKSYMAALERNPKLSIADYLIGKIYQSQQNTPLMEKYFNAAIESDPSFAPVYLDYHNYYADKDANKAIEYFNKYLQYADKSCTNDYFFADYLFRAARYEESLAKAKELENTDCKARVPVLYAYNNLRLGDSVAAKNNIEQFLANTPPSKVLPSDYEIAINILSRFAGKEAKTVEYINKLVEMDIPKNSQINYLNTAAKLLGNIGDYNQQIATIEKVAKLRGSKSEYDYYAITNALINAKEYSRAMTAADDYIKAFDTKPTGYDLLVSAARKLDSTNSTGILVDATIKQNSFLAKDSAKYKQKLINNYYTQLAYYNDVKKDYNKALEICDQILVLAPNEPQTLKFREAIKRNAEKKPTPAKSGSGKSTGSSTKPVVTDKTKKK